jgi:hypothetical protein
MTGAKDWNTRARTGRPTRLLEKDEQEVMGECEAFC